MSEESDGFLYISQGAARELLEAAKMVLAGLNERIDTASAHQIPVPVFCGIAGLRDAITKAENQPRIRTLRGNIDV